MFSCQQIKLYTFIPNLNTDKHIEYRYTQFKTAHYLLKFIKQSTYIICFSSVHKNIYNIHYTYSHKLTNTTVQLHRDSTKVSHLCAYNLSSTIDHPFDATVIRSFVSKFFGWNLVLNFIRKHFFGRTNFKGQITIEEKLIFNESLIYIKIGLIKNAEHECNECRAVEVEVEVEILICTYTIFFLFRINK